jgi:hypothetical protein
MNTTLLIDALVRQTTVLLAMLATSAGHRMPLARVANQVFADLVAELKAQGLGNKVIADMFGMALRTYHYRMARLAESATDRGQSLWEAVLRYIQQGGTVLRADVLRRFSRDDVEVVRSVLRDLVDSRVLYRTGRGEQAAYRVATEDLDRAGDDRGALTQLLLVAIHRHGPVALGDLARHVPVSEVVLAAELGRLVADGRVRTVEDGGVTRYAHDSILIHYGDDEGWQAALFDHYQAMVAAMCAKLRRGQTRASADESIGGSTYHFDVWTGHPLEGEVLGLLGDLRRRALDLCERVQAINQELAPAGAATARRVTAYVGQTVIEDEEETDDDNDDA